MKKKIKCTESKIAIGIFQNDVESFLEKFKVDVAGKVKKYREYAQESQKRKKI